MTRAEVPSAPKEANDPLGQPSLSTCTRLPVPSLGSKPSARLQRSRPKFCFPPQTLLVFDGRDMDSNAKAKATGRSHPRPQAVLMGNARFHARGTWPPPPPQAVTVGMGRGRWSSIALPCPHAVKHTEHPDFVPPKSHARPRDLGACGAASHTYTSLPPSAGQRNCYAPCCFRLRGRRVGWVASRGHAP